MDTKRFIRIAAAAMLAVLAWSETILAKGVEWT